MKLISKIIILFVSNALAFLLAEYFVSGFSISHNPIDFIKVIAIFTVVNILVRPLLKVVLSPIIFITLGLGIIIVNAIVLYIVDYLSADLTIAGLYPLVYATLIIGIVNLIFSLGSKK